MSRKAARGISASRSCADEPEWFRACPSLWLQLPVATTGHWRGRQVSRPSPRPPVHAHPTSHIGRPPRNSAAASRKDIRDAFFPRYRTSGDKDVARLTQVGTPHSCGEFDVPITSRQIRLEISNSKPATE